MKSEGGHECHNQQSVGFFSCLFMMAFLLSLRHKKTIKEMCKYTDIEAVELPNGKHEVTDNPPRWFKVQFEKAFGELLFV